MAEPIAQAEVQLTIDGRKLEAELTQKLRTAARTAESRVELLPGTAATRSFQPPIVGPSSRIGPTELEKRFAATAPPPLPIQPKGLAAISAGLDKAATSANLFKASIAATAAIKFGSVVSREIGAAINAYSSFQEQATAIKVQFGEASETLFDFAETASQTAGVSERAALQASLTFGAFFDQLKLAPAVTAQLSRGLVQLAGDFASFRDVATDEAIRIITSGLAGESEPLRRRGIIVDEQTVKQKAFNLGLGETGRELTQQEKVLSRAAVIFEGLSKAQGDFARTGENLANTERQLTANTENLRKELGELATPAAAGATSAINDMVLSVEKLVDVVPGAEGVMRELGKGFAAVAGNIVTGGLSTAFTVLGKAFGATTSQEQIATTVNEEYKATQEALNIAIQAAKGDTDSYTKALEALNLGLITNIEDIDKFVDAQLKFVGQQFDVENAQLRIVNAQDRVKEAQREYTEALTGGSDAVDKQIDSLQRLERAQERILDVQARIIKLTDDVSEAEAGVIEARFRFGAQSKEVDEATDTLRDKQEDLRSTNVDLKHATQDAAQADEDYKEATDKAKDGSDTLRDASNDLKKAQQDLKQALFDSAIKAGELEIAQREMNGETLTGINRAEIYKKKLEEIAGTLSPDSDLRRFLLETSEAFKNLFPTIQVPPEIAALLGKEFSSGASSGTSGSALLTQRDIPEVKAPRMTPTDLLNSTAEADRLARSKGNVQIIQYSPTDPLHTADEIAWRQGI